MKEHIDYVAKWFKNHNYTHPTKNDCFQISMTILGGDVGTIKKIAMAVYETMNP